MMIDCGQVALIYCACNNFELIMSKPESIKIEPWTDFPRLPYTFISDDFVHEKLFVAKVNAKGASSTVNLKASVSEDKTSKSVSDEAKLWFDLPKGRSLYAKIKSSSYLKLQLDNGVTEHWGKKWNLYAGLNTTKSLENISVRLGAAHLDSVCHSDNRLRIDYNADSSNSLTWYNRTVVNHDKFTFGLLGAYGLTSHILVKNNLLFGYKVDSNTTTYLRLENNGYRKVGFNWGDFSGYFDSVKFDVISSFKGWKWGLEAVLNTKGKLFNEALLAFEHTFSDHNLTFKARVSSNFNVSLLLRHPSLFFKDIAKTSVGFHVNEIHTQKRNFKYGGQIEFNV